MEKLIKKENGQWDIEKIELNLDDEIEQSKSGKVKPEPEIPTDRKDTKANVRQDRLLAEKKSRENFKQQQAKPAESPFKVDQPKVPLTKSELEEKIEQLEKALEDLKKQSFKDVKAANAGKELVGIKGYGSEAKIGGGPAMTGKPRHYQMRTGEGEPATTKSGKPIMSTNGPAGSEPYHADFTAEDHKDAYYVHGIEANQHRGRKDQVHPDLIAHHDGMASAHWKAYQDMLKQKRGG